MRFFSGTRGGDKKKTSASELFKQKQSGKKVPEKTADEKYKDMIEAKMHKMMEDAIKGVKKAGPRIPGTRKEEEGPPKELTKNAKLMLQMLAIKKIKNDEKKDKKRKQQEMWAAKAKKKAAALVEAQKSAADLAAKQQADADAAAAAAAWYSTPTDNNSW